MARPKITKQQTQNPVGEKPCKHNLLGGWVWGLQEKGNIFFVKKKERQEGEKYVQKGGLGKNGELPSSETWAG